ncbi:MAG: TatD family hydrolase [Agarilytica sp.]
MSAQEIESERFCPESGPSFFIDSHCHLDFSDFDLDRGKIWRASKQCGVSSAIVPGVAPEQWGRAKKIAKQFNEIYYAVGVHPWWVNALFAHGESMDSVVAGLREQQRKALKEKKCVAVGECGLDKMIQASAEHQYAIFDYQVKLAVEYDKPLIIHSRKAHNEVMHHIDRVDVARGGVIHAFSGSYELARQYVDRGFYLGIGGTITYERAKKTRDALAKLPLESLLLETDAPDMPLQGKQGQRNSPEFIPDIAKVVAEIKNESVEKVAQVTTQNACTLFSLEPAKFACS